MRYILKQNNVTVMEYQTHDAMDSFINLMNLSLVRTSKIVSYDNLCELIDTKRNKSLGFYKWFSYSVK